mgnify:CR=1 FL=1
MEEEQKSKHQKLIEEFGIDYEEVYVLTFWW